MINTNTRVSTFGRHATTRRAPLVGADERPVHIVDSYPDTAAEAAELGAILVASSQALHRVTGCQKTYVAQFAEAEGFTHTHFHVIPRPADLPAEHIGPGAFWYLARPSAEEVPQTERDDLARRLRSAMADVLR